MDGKFNLANALIKAYFGKFLTAMCYRADCAWD